MNPEAAVVIWLVGTVVGVLVLYLIVRFAVQHGMTSALRAHEAWMHDGSREAYFDKHVEDLAERERLREEDQQILYGQKKLNRPSTSKDLPS